MVSARVAAEAVNELTLKPDQSERADHHRLLLGGVELFRREGDFEIENAGRRYQALGMFARLEDAPAIGALALEDAGAVMQAVREDMHFGVAPRNQAAIDPDEAVALVEGRNAHQGPPGRPFWWTARPPLPKKGAALPLCFPPGRLTSNFPPEICQQH